MIHQARIEILVPHVDSRQSFQEVLRSPKVRQISHCIMHTGVEKPRHYHRRQTDWWYVPIGALALELQDVRPGSPTDGERQEIMLGEIYTPCVVEIPPGVLHGCRVLQGPCHLIYATSRVYDPDDEFRV
jgi:dTDP-4-dehydrorhamnose 3,5-epimerase-like enzyme